MQINSKSMKNATSPLFRNHNRSALEAGTYITHRVMYSTCLLYNRLWKYCCSMMFHWDQKGAVPIDLVQRWRPSVSQMEHLWTALMPFWLWPDDIVSWEPEGSYCSSKMFRWEAEGRYSLPLYSTWNYLYTTLNCNSALLALNWRYVAFEINLMFMKQALSIDISHILLHAPLSIG